MTPRRLTADLVGLASTYLDGNDRALLATLARLRVATGLQLQRLHHGSVDDPAAKQRRIRQLRRLARARLVTRLDRRVGGPGGGSFSSIYSLDVAGVRLTDPQVRRPRRPWSTSSAHLAHALAVTEVFVALHEAARDDDFEIAQFNAEPACWRQLSVPRRGEVWLKPDAHVVITRGEDELHWFVEVDRNTESAPWITDKARLYVRYWNSGREEADHGVHPRALWLTPDDVRRDVLARALVRLNAEDWQLFAVACFDDAVALITGAVEVAPLRRRT